MHIYKQIPSRSCFFCRETALESNLNFTKDFYLSGLWILSSTNPLKATETNYEIQRGGRVRIRKSKTSTFL